MGGGGRTLSEHVPADGADNRPARQSGESDLDSGWYYHGSHIGGFRHRKIVSIDPFSPSMRERIQLPKMRVENVTIIR